MYHEMFSIIFHGFALEKDKSWHIFYVQNLHLPSCWMQKGSVSVKFKNLESHGNCCWVSHARCIQICLWQGILFPPDSMMGWTLKNSERVFWRSTESHQVPLSRRQSAGCQNILHTWDLEDWIWTAIFLISLFQETLHHDPLAILNWVNVGSRRKAQHSVERKEGM